LEPKALFVGSAMQSRPLPPAFVGVEHELLRRCHLRKCDFAAEVLKEKYFSPKAMEVVTAFSIRAYMRKTMPAHTAQSRRNGSVPPRVSGARISFWSKCCKMSLRWRSACSLMHGAPAKARGRVTLALHGGRPSSMVRTSNARVRLSCGIPNLRELD